MRTISLTRGLVALVDDQDFEYLSQWLWYASDVGNSCFYAVRNNDTRTGQEYMHKVIASRMGLSGRVDHRDLDKLNNQRGNIRACTQAQNNANRPKQWNNVSGFKGVSWNKRECKWKAFISYQNRTIALGSYDDRIKAARAYNRAARRLYGEFAVLNPVEDANDVQ